MLARSDPPEDEAGIIIARAANNTRQKLSNIHLTLPEYFSAYRAFGEGDTESLQALCTLTENRQREEVPVPDSKAIHTEGADQYTPERLGMHRRIAKTFLRGVPKSSSPRFTAVLGGFGVGKTENLRRTIKGDEPAYVSDPDAIRPYLLPDYDAANHRHVLQTSREVTDISDRLLAQALGQRMNIICETTVRDPTWWSRALTYVHDLGYEVDVHIATRTLQECFRRVIALRDRPARVNDYLDLAGRFPNFIRIASHTAARRVSVTNLLSPESNAVHPRDCAITGSYVQQINERPGIIASDSE